MKKLLGLTILAAALLAFVSCASTKAAEVEAAPAVNPAREAAMAEEGAIDLATWKAVDSWAVKFNETEYTVTMDGGEFIQFPLDKELAEGDKIKVHLTGTNGGKSGFRSWVIDNNQTTNSDIYMGCAFDALPQGDFDVTYELTATKPAMHLFIKGPQWGTMLEKLTFKTVAVIYE